MSFPNSEQKEEERQPARQQHYLQREDDPCQSICGAVHCRRHPLPRLLLADCGLEIMQGQQPTPGPHVQEDETGIITNLQLQS